jgi:ParB family transcriptional regulator, chromosome partitioning protein
VHHPKQRPQKVADDAKWKGEQEKQRREHAIANATDLRVLAAVSAAVPVRLIKRDLLFILEKLITLIDERRLEVLARQHGIRQKRDDGGISKTLTAFLPPPGFSEVAVGTIIADRPPHRSARALISACGSYLG